MGFYNSEEKCIDRLMHFLYDVCEVKKSDTFIFSGHEIFIGKQKIGTYSWSDFPGNVPVFKFYDSSLNHQVQTTMKEKTGIEYRDQLAKEL